MDFVEELAWRGMVHSQTPGIQERLAKSPVTGYAGFDPTASSLQIGNLAAIMLLMHLQRSGHKPIALVGGATALIGDPSGKSEERNLMTRGQVEHNQNRFQEQLKNFLDFDCGTLSAEVVNNCDWFKDIGFIEFLRETGKHLTVNYMMAKDSVQQRLETGISFTEFSYQLLQAHDFCHLNTTKDCILQLGGSDQWGNITSGTELIRRKTGREAFALTCPLVTRVDGTKFGKTASGEAIWLDPEQTSPYKFYQFWLNSGDKEASRYIRVFTLMDKEEIAGLEHEHVLAPHERILQKALAKNITIRVHSNEAYEKAVAASEILFGKATTDTLRKLDERSFLDVFTGVPQVSASRDTMSRGVDIVELLTDISGFCSSRGEARRLIRSGGISINKEKVADENATISVDHLLNDKYVLLQKGKKSYCIVESR